MECSICYIKSNEEENPRINATFVTLPCEGTQHLNQKHVLCFHCFIVNHETSHGKCPVCRDNYMDYVRETHDVPEMGYMPTDIMTFAGNLSSPIPPPEVLSEFDYDIPNISRQEESITIIRDDDGPVETFEEFARYVMEHLSYDTEEEPVINRCIVCGVDIGEDNPRQYCEKTYCPEEI
jgi:hypothetical protein